MPTFRSLVTYADGAPTSTDRILFETSGNGPRGVAPIDLPIAAAQTTYDDTASELGENVQAALDTLGALSGKYVPLSDVTVSGTSDSPATATRRRYTNSGSITITLDDAFADGGEGILIKAGTGTITIQPGSGKTINGDGSSLTLASHCSVWRIGTDFTVVGGTTAVKDFDSSPLTNHRPHVQIKSSNYTLTTADSGSVIYCTAAITITWPDLGDFHCTVVASGGNVTIDGTGGVNATVDDENSATLIQANNTQSVWEFGPRAVVS